MLAILTDPELIVGGTVIFFGLIALLTALRIILRRESSATRRIRVGFFVERDQREESDDDV
jgi:hypothetical protein